MQPSEIIRVKAEDETVGCDGGGGPLGHPLVYLRFEGKPKVDCYYCSRRFAKPAYFESQHESAA
jgi:uncharacterized Zn-finger protein